MRKYGLRAVLIVIVAAMLMTACGGRAGNAGNNSSADLSGSTVQNGTAASGQEENETGDSSGKTYADGDIFSRMMDNTEANDAQTGADPFDLNNPEAREAFRHKVELSGSMPAVCVYTQNAEPVTSITDYLACTVDIIGGEGDKLEDAPAGIRVRGNSSAYYGDVEQILANEVPYKIKFDKKTGLLGLNDGAKCKSWVLLKADWNLATNDMMFRIGRAILPESAFCSDSQFVHVYINGELKGNYVLCEQCQVNRHRVDINEPAKDYTGTDTGYYVELDNYAWDGTDPFFVVTYADEATVTDIDGTERAFVASEYSIKSEIRSQAQQDFIGRYVENVFRIIYEAGEHGRYYALDENANLISSDYGNAEEAVEAVLDVDAAIGMYFLEELSMDNDCGEGSFFMCVDFSKDSTHKKLTFTSPWDFNWGFELAPDYGNYASVFRYQKFVDDFGDRSNPWFIELMKQDWFKKRVYARWQELSAAGTVADCLDEEARILEGYRDDIGKNEGWKVDCALELVEWTRQRSEWMTETFR